MHSKVQLRAYVRKYENIRTFAFYKKKTKIKTKTKQNKTTTTTKTAKWFSYPFQIIAHQRGGERGWRGAKYWLLLEGVDTF